MAPAPQRWRERGILGHESTLRVAVHCSGRQVRDPVHSAALTQTRNGRAASRHYGIDAVDWRHGGNNVRAARELGDSLC